MGITPRHMSSPPLVFSSPRPDGADDKYFGTHATMQDLAIITSPRFAAKPGTLPTAQLHIFEKLQDLTMALKTLTRTAVIEEEQEQVAPSASAKRLTVPLEPQRPKSALAARAPAAPRKPSFKAATVMAQCVVRTRRVVESEKRPFLEELHQMHLKEARGSFMRFSNSSSSGNTARPSAPAVAMMAESDEPFGEMHHRLVHGRLMGPRSSDATPTRPRSANAGGRRPSFSDTSVSTATAAASQRWTPSPPSAHDGSVASRPRRSFNCSGGESHLSALNDREVYAAAAPPAKGRPQRPFREELERQRRQRNTGGNYMKFCSVNDRELGKSL